MTEKGSRMQFISLLGVVFTVALTFVTMVLPRTINRMLSSIFPDIHPYIEPERVEEFIRIVRPIGYVCLFAVVILIVVGFMTERKNLSILGSLAFIFPIFASFASQMFFLAGIGILRVLWLPLWEISPNLLKLGDIVYLPYMILMYPFSLVNLDVRIGMVLRMGIAYTIIGLGLLIFLYGTITWFQSKFKGDDVADFWIYRYSRHPQYLGFILWSYGVMLLGSLSPVPFGGINPSPSLPWMISTLIVVCIALKEEITMTLSNEEKYQKYRERVPFMLPLPGFIVAAITYPFRVVIKSDIPRNGKEVVYVFMVYTVLLILLSLPFYLLNWPPGGWHSLS